MRLQLKLANLSALTEEIERYKAAHQYTECIAMMDTYEEVTSNPLIKAVILTAKATCAIKMGNVEVADNALAVVPRESLPETMIRYVDLVKASAAHLGGQLNEAEKLLADILTKELSGSERDPGILYEALARRGFVQADLGHFDEALELLGNASLIDDNGEFKGSIRLYEAYCLQGLGRLDEAEYCLSNVAVTAVEEIDTYYRLGAIHLQQGKLVQAKGDFERALSVPPNGRISRSDIVIALKETEKELTKVRRLDSLKETSRARPS